MCKVIENVCKMQCVSTFSVFLGSKNPTFSVSWERFLFTWRGVFLFDESVHGCGCHQGEGQGEVGSDFDSIKFQISARKVLFFLSGYFFFFQGQREWLEDLSSLSRCCAFSFPCSAARRYHLIAVAVFFSTPLPRR